MPPSATRVLTWGRCKNDIGHFHYEREVSQQLRKFSFLTLLIACMVSRYICITETQYDYLLERNRLMEKHEFSVQDLV